MTFKKMLGVAGATALLLCTAAAQEKKGVSIGGEPVVTLTAPKSAAKTPHFTSVTVLPGRGMNMYQVKAFLPGKGEIDLIASPPLQEGKKILDEGDDEYGNKAFSIGGAILLPYANRIRGKLSDDQKTLTTDIAGHQLTLPANWHGKNEGAERHAMHGLVLAAKFQDVKQQKTPAGASVSGVYHAGDFGGHWLSKSDVKVTTSVKANAVDMIVTVKNVGNDPLPLGISWHPYWNIPSGDRKQARLYLPGAQRALVNNYDDVFPTGQIEAVKGTKYDFTEKGGHELGDLYMDDNFTDLKFRADGSEVTEVIDPAAKYGLRIVTLSPKIKSVQIYAPPDKQFVVVEPQVNLADPYNIGIWKDKDTGMLNLKPGETATYHVRLELFTPGAEKAAKERPAAKK